MMNNPNMRGMMKKMKKMQKEMEESQENLAKKEYIGRASNDLVTVTMTGNRQVQEVNISKEIIDPENKEIIEDLVLIAVNDALEQIETESEETLSKYTNNLNLPGF